MLHTIISSLSKVKFLGEFCLDIESISTILSAAWNKTNSSTPIFSFLGYFLGMEGVLKSYRLNFESLWIADTESNFYYVVQVFLQNDWMNGMVHMTEWAIGDQSFQVLK